MIFVLFLNSIVALYLYESTENYVQNCSRIKFHIFILSGGVWDGTKHNTVTTGYYWTTKWYSSTYANSIYVNISNVAIGQQNSCRYGFSIRPVK